MSRKALPQDYSPTSPPVSFEDYPRYLDREFNKIAQTFKNQPVYSVVHGGGVIGIDTTPTTERLGQDDPAIIDQPEGSWDPVTATYTASISGIYTISCHSFIEAFGDGNKNYISTIEIKVNTVTRSRQVQGGPDDVPLAMTLRSDLLLLTGDTVWIQITTIHEQFTGASNYEFEMSYHRQSAP